VSHLEIVASSESDVLQIQKLSALLADSGGSASLASSDQQLTLPPSLYRAFKHLIDDLSAGKPVCLVREEEELTTQAAADLLNVSRPFFIKLLESGTLPYTMTGTHRRILLRDVLAYKKVRDAERRAILDRMAREEFAEGSYFGVPFEENEKDLAFKPRV